jgi:M6 family metalloprotease-like protein
MHRSTLRGLGGALAGGLALGVTAGGTAALPAASGTSASAPAVVQVSTDTPLSALPSTAAPRNPGVPVDPFPHRVTQPDGTVVTVRAWGDSQTGGYQTRGGYAVTKDAAGVWRYVVRVGPTGRAVASSLEVGKASPPAAARGVRRQVVARTATPALVERSPGTGTGTQPGLVILVSFADQPSLGTTEDQWSQAFFGPSGVSGYYTQNSFGKLALTPAAESGGVANNGVVGWLQLPYDHPDFKDDFSNPAEVKLAVDAIKAANPYVDYGSFDGDHNGVLSPSELHVTVIVAGYETSYGGDLDTCGNSVWGHQGGLYAAAPRVDGTVVNRAGGTMFGEYMCAGFDSPGHMSTMGIMAHEMGHDLGFPDLYDIDYSSAGISRWSLMSGGSWNYVGTAAHGTTPAGLDAFSKSYQGWITPVPIEGQVDNAPLPASATSPTAYRLLANPKGVDWKFESHKGTGEYYLVENRQLVGYDAGLPACGVIVYHVDESVRRSNKANADDVHRLLDVVEADGSTSMDTYPYPGGPGDVFPGSSGHVDFNDGTSPSAVLYSGAPSGVGMHVNGGCADPQSANFFVPLANDSFGSATPLAAPRGQVTGGNNGATKETGEPAVAGNAGGASVWWSFTAPATRALRLSTSGSTFDTLLGVYRGSSVAAATEVAGNDNASPTDPTSALVATVRRGVTYRIAVDGLNAGAGASQGAVSLGYTYAPANDDLKSATSLSGKHGRQGSSTVGASRERKEPRKIAGQRSGRTVWYEYRAHRAGRLTVDLSGSKFDTLLGVYTGSRMKKLHLVAADDNHGRGRSSRVTVAVQKGQTYRIAVAGVKTAVGSFRISWHL